MDGLAVLMGCSAEAFNQMVQANYGDLFVDDEPKPESFVNSLKSKITSDSTLNQNCYQS